MRYVDFRVDPFITAKIPSAKKRETHITIEQLKAIRDAKLTKHNISVVRDIFMLTYYLAGMNLVDMLAYDFRNTTEINYIRKKQETQRKGTASYHSQFLMRHFLLYIGIWTKEPDILYLGNTRTIQAAIMYLIENFRNWLKLQG